MYQYIGLRFVCCHKCTWHNNRFFLVYVSSSLNILKDIAINEFHFFLMLHVVRFYLINLLLSRRAEHVATSCFMLYDISLGFLSWQTGIEPEFVLFFDCPEEEMEKRVLNRNQVIHTFVACL